MPKWVQQKKGKRGRQWREWWAKPWTVPVARRKAADFKLACWRHGYLSPHLTRAEAASKGGDSCRCPAAPVPRRMMFRMQRFAFKFERVRHANGDRPFGFLSIYRSPCHNGCVGGASASKHKAGTAGDPAVPIQPGTKAHAAVRQSFKGIGYQGYVGGPIRHFDLGPRRVWVY